MGLVVGAQAERMQGACPTSRSDRRSVEHGNDRLPWGRLTSIPRCMAGGTTDSALLTISRPRYADGWGSTDRDLLVVIYPCALVAGNNYGNYSILCAPSSGRESRYLENGWGRGWIVIDWLAFGVSPDAMTIPISIEAGRVTSWRFLCPVAQALYRRGSTPQVPGSLGS